MNKSEQKTIQSEISGDIFIVANTNELKSLFILFQTLPIALYVFGYDLIDQFCTFHIQFIENVFMLFFCLLAIASSLRNMIFPAVYFLIVK